MTTGDHSAQSDMAGQVPSPFVQVASEILYSGVGSDAMHLYLILLDKSWKHGCCWPSNRTVGGWLGGKSHDTVDRIFKKLEQAGLIVRTTVPATESNPSGRLITVNGRVKPPRKSAEGGYAKKHPFRYANPRVILNTEEKKENGPPTPGNGAAPEQTIEQEIAGWRELAENPCRQIAEMARRKLAELESKHPRLSEVS